MSVLEVELSGPNLVCRAQLPDDVKIEDLVPTMATLVGDAPAASSRWMVATTALGRLSMHLTLAEVGLESGDTLHVARQVPATESDLSGALGHTGPASDPTFSLPDRVGTVRRIGIALGALLGTVATTGTVDAPPLRRAHDAWQWTDRRRRLEWVIRRPWLERSTTIGVVGVDASGAETAIALAEILSAVRPDRVVLVDGDPIRANATRLVPGRHASIGQVAAGLAEVDARFTPTRLVGVDLGQPSPPTQQEYRRALERIRRSAGIVVIDCGPAAHAPLAAICDQLVVVRRTTVTVLAGPSDAPHPNGTEGVVNLTDGDAHLELAALLMSRIARTGG